MVASIARITRGRGSGRARTRQPPMLRLPCHPFSLSRPFTCAVSLPPFVPVSVLTSVSRPSAPHPLRPAADFPPGDPTVHSFSYSGRTEGAFRTAVARITCASVYDAGDRKCGERIARSPDHVIRPARESPARLDVRRKNFVQCCYVTQDSSLLSRHIQRDLCAIGGVSRKVAHVRLFRKNIQRKPNVAGSGHTALNNRPSDPLTAEVCVLRFK